MEAQVDVLDRALAGAEFEQLKVIILSLRNADEKKQLMRSLVLSRSLSHPW